MGSERPWLAMFDDGRFRWSTTEVYLIKWVEAENKKQPAHCHVNYYGNEVAQVTYGGFWRINPNIDGALGLRWAVDRYYASH